MLAKPGNKTGPPLWPGPSCDVITGPINCIELGWITFPPFSDWSLLTQSTKFKTHKYNPIKKVFWLITWLGHAQILDAWHCLAAILTMINARVHIEIVESFMLSVDWSPNSELGLCSYGMGNKDLAHWLINSVMQCWKTICAPNVRVGNTCIWLWLLLSIWHK